MSRETKAALNRQTLIGFTDENGPAWHWDGRSANQFAGAVPLPAVHHLFDWAPISVPVSVPVLTADGVTTVSDPTKQLLVRLPDAERFGPADDGAVFGMFGADSYKTHLPNEWLTATLTELLDEQLQVASAGLLRRGAVAWLQVQFPETLQVAGYAYRPYVYGCTSFDGSKATTYGAGAQGIVCDNTLSIALSESARQALQVKIRHTSKSLSSKSLEGIRNTLGIVETAAADFATQVELLTSIDVSDRAWSAFLEAHAPTTQADGTPKVKASLTIAERTQSELSELWTSSPMVAPWSGTAFGVVQAVNTHLHHVSVVKGMTRTDRNLSRSITDGAVAKVDGQTIRTLNAVRPLPAAALQLVGSLVN